MSTTGFLPRKLDRVTCFLPVGSASVKSGAASPVLTRSGGRSPRAGGVLTSPGFLPCCAWPLSFATKRTAPAIRQPASAGTRKRLINLLPSAVLRNRYFEQHVHGWASATLWETSPKFSPSRPRL